MYEYYFTFVSVTHAQNAVRALERAGVPSRLVRTPRPIQTQGCGYSVFVRSGYYGQALDVLLREGSNYRRIFCRFPDGTFEEVKP